MNTYFSTNEDSLKNRKWVIFDAQGQVVGRLATQIASVLRGKHRPTFTPHNDSGDFVVVINAEKARFTGAKREKKIYYRHSLFPGGIKMDTPQELFATKPEEVLLRAVKSMMPKGSLGLQQLKKLRVYQGSEHPHAAQKLISMREAASL